MARRIAAVKAAKTSNKKKEDHESKRLEDVLSPFLDPRAGIERRLENSSDKPPFALERRKRDRRVGLQIFSKRWWLQRNYNNKEAMH